MERDKLDERLGERDRVDQEETFAPHMREERVTLDRDQLLKNYARIIDEQKEEIEKLHVIAEKWGWLNTKYIIQMQNLEGKWVNLEEHSTKKLATSAMPYYGKDFSLRIIERKYNDWVVKDI